MESEQWDEYAEEYYEYVISPFRKGVQNPFYGDVKKMDSKRLVAADLGAGRGDILPFLSEQFAKVYAVDFSREMLRICQDNNSELKNVVYQHADLRELSSKKLNFDVAISVNSLIQPDFGDAQKSASEIYASLSHGGRLIAIFPSMESIIHYSKLIFELELARDGDEKKALTRTRRRVQRGKYNFIKGIFEDVGEKQKFFYRFELKDMLEQAGFGNIKISKVSYPWNMLGDFEDLSSHFPDRRKMWDWYITASK